MPKQKIPALEYLRGISMLGVLGIHTGAYSLSNPHTNIHLFALLEICSRFSVPIFFFISAFGLFLHQDLSKPLDYWKFIKRRLRTVLLPYTVWSMLYILYSAWQSHNLAVLGPLNIIKSLFFGLASYQLYFLVVLLWFYALMPLWRKAVYLILQKPVCSLSGLLLMQILFDYYSSYILHANFANGFINMLLEYRLNYWVMHYFFIFLLGGVCAVQYEQFKIFLHKFSHSITVFFLFSLGGLLSFYYYLVLHKGYSLEESVNTAHQLSPFGILYTLGITIFLFKILSSPNIPKFLRACLSLLGVHSYFIYLFHPFAMYGLTAYLHHHGIIMNGLVTIIFYLSALSISILMAIMMKKAGTALPLISYLLTGASKAKRS
ncbi:MAG: acyltransferase [Pelosinus sp.]|nr:acyltransferase [Pelosinus sp.]